MFDWDSALLPKPSAEVTTSLGTLKLTVEGDYALHSELTEFVTINRQLCRVVVNSHLNRTTEDWTHYVHVDRVTLNPPTSYHPFTTHGRATDAAYKKVRAVVVPLIERWIDENVSTVEEGRRIADQNLIIRGNLRLDYAMQQINERRKTIAEAQAYFEQHGTLRDSDRQLLGDIYDTRYWRF